VKLFKRDSWFIYNRRQGKGIFTSTIAYRSAEGWRHSVEFRHEIAWRRKVSPGFSVRLGNRGSETPVDWMISLYWIAIFGSFAFPKLGQFCEWIGRGHKRQVSLKIHDGQIWWNLWYNDDMGYDNYHRCDKWRKPMLPPWRWGREKYRPWMCLREGNIELNPLDAFWGSRLYRYTDLDTKTKTLKMNQFPGDQYEIKLTLQEVHRGRDHGPRWAQRKKFSHWTVAWEVGGGGIPIRNHDWKGDGILASAERIDNPANWWVKALVQLYKRVEEERVKYNYRPPMTPEEVVNALSAEKLRLEMGWREANNDKKEND